MALTLRFCSLLPTLSPGITIKYECNQNHKTHSSQRKTKGKLDILPPKLMVSGTNVANCKRGDLHISWANSRKCGDLHMPWVNSHRGRTALGNDEQPPSWLWISNISSAHEHKENVKLGPIRFVQFSRPNEKGLLSWVSN